VKILIVKHGALGDVVRTSYFVEALRKKFQDRIYIGWLTKPVSAELLRFNPDINQVIFDGGECARIVWDVVYSLDDEQEALQTVASLRHRRLVGASVGSDGKPVYSDDAAEWFDMGLISRFGRSEADDRKRRNARSHAEIFCSIFDVNSVRPRFYGCREMTKWATERFSKRVFRIGINAGAGLRWPSKAFRHEYLPVLIRDISLWGSTRRRRFEIHLLGAGDEHKRNVECAAQLHEHHVSAIDTSDSVLRLAAAVASMNVMVTSDSLAMHLAIAQQVPTLAFFSATSAVEIDMFGRGEKVISTSPDYCSYRPNADNSTITPDRLLAQLQVLFARLPGVLEGENALDVRAEEAAGQEIENV